MRLIQISNDGTKGNYQAIETLRNIQDMLWICCRTKELIDFHRKKVGSQIWNNIFVEGNEKKKIRRDGRTRKKKNNHQILLGDVTLTHICLV